MAKTVKKALREGYESIRKSMEKLVRSSQSKSKPQLILQPIPVRKNN